MVAGPCLGLVFPRWVAERQQMSFTRPHSGVERIKWEKECDTPVTDTGSLTSAVMIITTFTVTVIIVVPETPTWPIG